MSAPDIFLSYNREDQASAKRFAKAFEAEGYSVWWDVTLRSGEAYDQVTEEALKTAKAVVVLWSKKSVVSRWVRAEATVADRNRTLVPVRIEPCDLPIMFELTQTADLSHWKGDTNDKVWLSFLTDMRRFIGAKTKPSQPAPAPEKPAFPAGGYRAAFAVLPFANRSRLPEDDILAEDMAEDLTAALSFNPRLKLVAASVAASYRNGAKDPRQIGQDLGVIYLLEGNVRRVGGNLRVTVQLLEVERGDILWTQKFERPLTDTAALQEELVMEVAAHLGIQMERVMQARALYATGVQNVWEMNMRTYAHTNANATREGRLAAVTAAKEAVDMDPLNGLSHAVLASVQAHLWHYCGGEDSELEREILDNIRLSRTLDPNDTLAFPSIAIALAWLNRPQEALPFAERAIAINPNSVDARFTLGMVLARLGRSEEAIAQLNAVERLAPNSSWGHWATLWISVAHLYAGQLDQALEQADQALRLFPDGEALIQNMLCLALSNDRSRTRDAMARLKGRESEMSIAQMENHIRSIYSASSAVNDYVALVGKIWREIEDERS